ncbi:MAG TPA: SDR family oxidoreductase [Thermoanaerobaculia bacterium]|nr:SDR family oxidoreductase [Thermoanaerobaculia bacterium]
MLPLNSFEGKRCLITGGGTGIGLAVAREVARLGGSVVLVSRSEEHLAPAVESIRTETGRDDAAEYHAVDVRNAEAIEELAVRCFADGRGIDCLVNNAAGNFIVRAEELTINGWNAVIGIVLNGTFYCSSSLGRRMIERGKGGVILNVVANYAWTGAAGVVHSASAKAGVLAMTRTLAVEWARHGIRVNAIAPGPVDTAGASQRLFPDERIQEGIRRTIPLRRFAALDEVAWAASYLLSEFAAYVTGEVFVIDGGQWLSGADYWGRVTQTSS